MADILLNKPAAGGSREIGTETGSRFFIEFDPHTSLMQREGDSFVFSFADGSNVTLTDFYKTYSNDTMPSFAMQGTEVTGQQFFAAMNVEKLMPDPQGGAGSSNSATKTTGHYSEYGNMALLSGLDRLNGEDAGWSDGGVIDNELDAMAAPNDDEEPVHHAVSIAAEDTDESAATLRFVLTLDSAAQGDIVAVVSVGGREYEVAFAEGEATKVLEVENTFNTEDVYKDPGAVAAHIVSVSGGEGIEVSIAREEAVAQIADSIDNTDVTISGEDIEEGAAAVF
ncbi:MAG: hypothetical protein II737_04760, partial [Mailhella sp.]|nr:hypothetical protein [Mailhella sp.]